MVNSSIPNKFTPRPDQKTWEMRDVNYFISEPRAINHFVERRWMNEDTLRCIFCLKLSDLSGHHSVVERSAPRAEFSETEWKLIEELASRQLVNISSNEAVLVKGLLKHLDKFWVWVDSDRDFLEWKGKIDADPFLRVLVQNRSEIAGASYEQGKSWLLGRARRGRRSRLLKRCAIVIISATAMVIACAFRENIYMWSALGLDEAWNFINKSNSRK